MDTNDQINGAGKPVQSNTGTPGLEPERSREGVGGSAPHTSEMGTVEQLPAGENPATPVAGIVSVQPRFFNFDAQGLRVVGDVERPWFVAKDVCEALEIDWKGSGNSGSLASLDDDEKGSATIATLGGPQEMGVINESGLYALIFRSRKPQAKLFRRWVTNEVLPAIRRTGGYEVGRKPKRRRFCEYTSVLTPSVVLAVFAKEPMSRSAGLRVVQAAHGEAASRTTYFDRVNELLDAGLLVRYGQMLTPSLEVTS